MSWRMQRLEMLPWMANWTLSLQLATSALLPGCCICKGKRTAGEAKRAGQPQGVAAVGPGEYGKRLEDRDGERGGGEGKIKGAGGGGSKDGIH